MLDYELSWKAQINIVVFVTNFFGVFIDVLVA